MSGGYELVTQVDGLRSLVGWNARLETFFLVVYRNEFSRDSIGPTEMLFGTSPGDLPTIGSLQRAAVTYGQIAADTRGALVADQGTDAADGTGSPELRRRTFEEWLLCVEAEDLARGRCHLSLVHDGAGGEDALDVFQVRVAHRLRGCWYRIASGRTWCTLTIDADATAIVDLVGLVEPGRQADWRVYETNRPNDARFGCPIEPDAYGWR